jgi:YD repeat-containing protein
VTFAYDSASERVTTITRPDSTTETFKADQLRGFDTTGTSGSPANPTLLAEAHGTYTDPLSNVTDTRPDWGGLGLTGQMTDASGNIATNDRDANGLATITLDRLNRIDLYSFDTKGNVLQHTYPDLSTDEYTWNSFAEPLTHTDTLNHTTTYLYDQSGNGPNVTVTIDPMNNRTTMTYTADGKLATLTDPNNHTTSYQYDNQDRLTTVTNADSTTRTLAYDSQGDVVSVVDERSNTTTYSFDKLNHQTGMKDALGNQTTYMYDAAGNRTQVQAPTPNGQTARTTSYSYDSLNRVTTVTDPSAIRQSPATTREATPRPIPTGSAAPRLRITMPSTDPRS